MYKRGEPWPLEVFPYEQILSFGAPLANAYKITIEGREIVFETQMVRTTTQTFEINQIILQLANASYSHVKVHLTDLGEHADDEMKHQPLILKHHELYKRFLFLCRSWTSPS